MSKSTFKILFYLRKNYLNKEGKAGIMIRLSLNGEISQFSSKLDIEPDKWDTTLGPATLAKYDRCYRRLEEFMKVKYNISDISLKEIGHMFITDFENYLRTESKCNENTTAKFMQTFKMIVIIAKNNGWIYTDPFSNFICGREGTEGKRHQNLV